MELDAPPSELLSYQGLLSAGASANHNSSIRSEHEEVKAAPLIWWDVKDNLDQHTEENSEPILQQYAVLGHVTSGSNDTLRKPVLLNTNAPWSAFLCGSQGSGKSHALSCMLENCLLQDPTIGKNPNCLAGMVFHYDSLNTDQVCEAAFLCSSVKTKVLVSKSNYGKLKKKYEEMAKKHGGEIEVETLELHPSYLNTERVKTMMGVGKAEDMPLYMRVVVNILRDMAIKSEGLGEFDYNQFMKQVEDECFTDKQSGPLKLRIKLLESFLVARSSQSTGGTSDEKRDLLVGSPGYLTIVDLSDPVIDTKMACVLFDICLSVFLSQSKCGTVVALDEAHNYMSSESEAASDFTKRLVKTIREQRHNGARVIIATQEPTISGKLLALSSIVMAHRFTSPAWLEKLRKHVAVTSEYNNRGKNDMGDDGAVEDDKRDGVFQKIVRLGLGESLLFSDMAVVNMIEGNGVEKLNERYVQFRTRKRITADGGQTKLAENDGKGSDGVKGGT